MTDILDFLREETRREVDRVGFDFLRSVGYEVEPSDRASLDALRKKMKRDGVRLVYDSKKTDGGFLVRFYLKRGKKKLAESKLLYLKYKSEGDEKTDGEEQSQG